MRVFGLVIGGTVVLVGAVLLAAPSVLLSLGPLVATPGGLYVIAALRIALGLVCVFAATASRAPRTLRVLGVMVVVAGLATPSFGVARTRLVFEWWTGAGPWFTRLVAGVLMAIGGFFVYAFLPPARTT
jgi:hypothetical protein